MRLRKETTLAVLLLAGPVVSCRSQVVRYDLPVGFTEGWVVAEYGDPSCPAFVDGIKMATDGYACTSAREVEGSYQLEVYRILSDGKRVVLPPSLVQRYRSFIVDHCGVHGHGFWVGRRVPYDDNFHSVLDAHNPRCAR